MSPDTVWVYTLDDPRSGAPRYVGRSVSPKDRLQQHKHMAHRLVDPPPVGAWIEDLREEGLEPVLQVRQGASGGASELCEAAWIDHLESEDCDLLNAVYPLGGEERVVVKVYDDDRAWVEERYPGLTWAERLRALRRDHPKAEAPGVEASSPEVDP